MTKALSSICLLVPLIIAVQREKKEANSVKDVHDVFVCGSVIERRAFLSSAAIMRVHLSRSQARSSCGSELGVAGGRGRGQVHTHAITAAARFMIWHNEFA